MKNTEKKTIFSMYDLRKSFPNPSREGEYFEAIAGLSLEIFESETTLIAGANGSGKTLLMKILAGLMEPSQGKILYCGEPIEKSKNLLRRSVGLVFQDPDAQILGETVEEDIRFGPENLKMPKEKIDRITKETLAALNLSTKKDFPSRHLSGGEKRRLAVAGILAMGCDTIIMDEPFANLDWPGVLQVLNIISTLKQQKKTLIILTHELEKVLAFADRLIILADGKLRDDGASEDVLNRLDPAWGVRDPRGHYRSAADCTWVPLKQSDK